MELKDYWQTIRRRWMTVAVCFLLAVAAAAAWTWQATPLYSSSTSLFVSTSPSDSADAYQGNLFATQRVTSYAELVEKRAMAERVAEDLGGGFDPDELQASVSTSVNPETVILQISVTDADPVQARDIAQAYAEALTDVVAQLETPEGKSAALVKVSLVDNARVGSTPVSPQPVRNIGLGAVLGLLLGVGLAVARQLLDTSVSSAEDVTEVTDTPLLGHINADSNAARQSPAVALGGASPWAEGFRVLRTNMQYVEADRDHRVFVVSSSLPGEGKTTTATSLAITLATAGHSVALVECDLRRPLMAGRLGLDAAVGTTSVLIGKVKLSDALQPYEDTGLQVLTSGPNPPNPSELLQSQAMESMLAELREQFDIVILDAPPLLPVTDAALLAARADGAIVVVRHGKTTRDQLRLAIERVQSVDAKVLGVVINLAPARKSARSYGYGYGYGYGYTSEAVSGAGGSSSPAARRPGRRTRRR